MNEPEKVNGELANSSQNNFVFVDPSAVVCEKLDRIIALLERMVEPEEPPLACPKCGNNETLDTFTNDGVERVLCMACSHRFTLSAELVG